MKRYIRFMMSHIKLVIKLFKTYVLRDRVLISVKKWFKDEGDPTLRLNYPLNKNSGVL